MTHALITIDTELSAGWQAQGRSLEENYQSSFIGKAQGSVYGVPWLMERMSAHGITGVFFVDPMPGLVHGPEIVERMVHPIIAAGHDVQIHIHTEWLQWAHNSPVEGRQGQSIGDFSLEDQISLIGWARDALMKAGAPYPNAFRAGNFGANDDTLTALTTLGVGWDSSFNASYAGRACQITLASGTVEPVAIGGITEAPVATIFDRPGHFRPAQICALSAAEMRQGLYHAAATGAHSFVTVTHSFEMLSRDRQRPNRMVMRRCEALCEAIATHPHIQAATFGALPPASATGAHGNEQSLRLPPNRLRTLYRQAEQAYATWRYEHQLKPA